MLPTRDRVCLSFRSSLQRGDNLSAFFIACKQEHECTYLTDIVLGKKVAHLRVGEGHWANSSDARIYLRFRTDRALVRNDVGCLGRVCVLCGKQWCDIEANYLGAAGHTRNSHSCCHLLLEYPLSLICEFYRP